MIPRAVPYPAVARDLLCVIVRQTKLVVAAMASSRHNDIWMYAILVDPRLYWASCFEKVLDDEF